MKVICIGLFVLLLASNAFWFFAAIDQGISFTYLEASYETLERAHQQLIQLSNLNLIGLTADEAKHLIGHDVYNSEPYIKEGCLQAGQICMKLDGANQIVAIE
ncbi:hypothetical protein [Motilimonas sp. KMU-193]|uniref:hypothetical protein n=1 Tax=Motilimonas sp. KMU-193 TaxID=3388668 RepID=UPI00396B37F3